jgi:hypothetical protein
MAQGLPVIHPKNVFTQPSNLWTTEHAGDGYPPQSTDAGDDEPTPHELAYVEGDEVP